MSLKNTIKLVKLLVNKETAVEIAFYTLSKLFENPTTVATLYNLITSENEPSLKHYLESPSIQVIISSPSFKENLYTLAIEKDSSALSFIHEEFPHNSNFCLKAAQYNGLALEYVPKTVVDYFEIALAAIEQNPESVQYIPKSLAPALKKQLYLAAVTKDGLALEYIFDGQSDLEICKAAIEENIFAMEFVDEDLRSQILANRKQYYLTRNYMVHTYFAENQQSITRSFLK